MSYPPCDGMATRMSSTFLPRDRSGRHERLREGVRNEQPPSGTTKQERRRVACSGDQPRSIEPGGNRQRCGHMSETDSMGLCCTDCRVCRHKCLLHRAVSIEHFTRCCDGELCGLGASRCAAHAVANYRPSAIDGDGPPILVLWPVPCRARTTEVEFHTSRCTRPEAPCEGHLWPLDATTPRGRWLPGRWHGQRTTAAALVGLCPATSADHTLTESSVACPLSAIPHRPI